MTLEKSICLHIGCGLVTPDGWENIDASPSLRLSQIPIIGRYLVAMRKGPDWAKSAQYGDIVRGLNLQPDTCELIFASHVLEHLSLKDFHVAMDNIYKYLKPGGYFRAIVPDLEALINRYVRQRADSAMATKAASDFVTDTWMGHPGSRRNFYLRLQESFANSRHQWMWDEFSLFDAFFQHSFKNIKRCKHGEWSDPRFAKVDCEL